MGETRWVQHISRQGQKWKLTCEGPSDSACWYVGPYALPKSEYRLCEPPERWVDVTAHCFYQGNTLMEGPEEGGHKWILSVEGIHSGGYRLRKIDCDTADKKWAFIVEKKEPA